MYVSLYSWLPIDFPNVWFMPLFLDGIMLWGGAVTAPIPIHDSPGCHDHECHHPSFDSREYLYQIGTSHHQLIKTGYPCFESCVLIISKYTLLNREKEIYSACLILSTFTVLNLIVKHLQISVRGAAATEMLASSTHSDTYSYKTFLVSEAAVVLNSNPSNSSSNSSRLSWL